LIQFMTRLPVPVSFEYDNEDFGKALTFAPLVGLLIGLILSISAYILSIVFPNYITAILIFSIYIFLTGGLHFDGLGDTFDGIYSGAAKERILEIMRDSRIGTNGLLAVVLISLLDISLLCSFDKKQLLNVVLLFPVAGRIGSLTSASFSTYARKSEGMGKSFIDYCGKKEFIIGLIIYFSIFFLITGIKGLLASAILPISAYILVKVLGRKIDGATGDVLGAVCELNQTVFLIEAYLLSNFLI
jgi:adenosylcobinamide-GDP ribazoletransferase